MSATITLSLANICLFLLNRYATKLMTNNNFQRPRAGQHDDNAHPPITPAKAVDPQSIQDPTQRNVYILITKHYLACCSRDAMGRETELIVRMGPEEFTAKGLMILEKNWLEIYAPWERWSTGQGELPPLVEGSHDYSEFVASQGRTYGSASANIRYERTLCFNERSVCVHPFVRFAN